MHPTPGERQDCRGGSRRVFRQFRGLKPGSAKTALPPPDHQRTTLTVGRFLNGKRNGMSSKYVGVYET
jgi:hypothetical protein